MKLGIFDSGLGGLTIAKAIHESMPELDIVYLGDTLRLPYGNRSDEAIYRFTKRGVDYLFRTHDCALVIIGCNTASAKALRRLQQTYLPDAYPGRNVLGVIVPTLEVATDAGFTNIGLVATNATVRSGIYAEELKKISPAIQMTSKATPLLVPLLENDGEKWLADILADYLAPLKEASVDCVLLGCTHYALLKEQVGDVMGPATKILSQDEIIPPKLLDYLERHPEYAEKMTKGRKIEFYVSDLTDSYARAAAKIYGRAIDIVQAEF